MHSAFKSVTFGLLGAAFFGSAAVAATMTFEPGTGVETPSSWTEGGLVATFYGVTAAENIKFGFGVNSDYGLVSGGDGPGGPGPNSDVIFSVPGGGIFSLTSMDFRGGGITLLKAFDIHGNQVAGVALTGLAAHIVFDSSWQNLGAVDYCSYCFTTFGNANAIDNLAFNVTTPVPAALPLFATGLAGLGWLARRRRIRAKA